MLLGLLFQWYLGIYASSEPDTRKRREQMPTVGFLLLFVDSKRGRVREGLNKENIHPRLPHHCVGSPRGCYKTHCRSGVQLRIRGMASVWNLEGK